MKLKGFLQSGLFFLGDPVYMSGDTRDGADNSLCNPFLDWDKFTQGLEGKDANMAFPGSSDDQIGRGCAIQTGRLSGQFEIEKDVDEEGKLLQLRVIFRD